MYASMHACMRMETFVCMNVCINVYMHECMYVHMYLFIRIILYGKLPVLVSTYCRYIHINVHHYIYTLCMDWSPRPHYAKNPGHASSSADGADSVFLPGERLLPILHESSAHRAWHNHKTKTCTGNLTVR